MLNWLMSEMLVEGHYFNIFVECWFLSTKSARFSTTDHFTASLYLTDICSTEQWRHLYILVNSSDSVLIAEEKEVSLNAVVWHEHGGVFFIFIFLGN